MEDLYALNSVEQKKMLADFAEDLNLKKAESALSRILGAGFTLRLISANASTSDEKIKERICRPGKSGKCASFPCIDAVKDCIQKAKKSAGVEVFQCPVSGYGFCYALKKESDTLGYVIGCRLSEKPSQAHLDLFGYFAETVLSSIKKEAQLAELYKTIKPRAIALSTVHTVHRLISSSLYLDELLMRVARLSMQILNAQRCSIKLVDSKKKTLLPKVTVDHRKAKARLKKVKIGRWAPGKAVKYGKSIKGDRYLATPLIDEEVIGVITLYDKADKQPFNNFDVEIMRTMCEQAAVAIKNAQLYKEQEKLTMGSIRALAQIIESRSAGICTPKSSFLRIAQLMGQEFGLREHDLKILQYAALLHDAGELMVPENLLRKRGKLTEKEYKLIKEHPLKGAKIIKSLKSLKQVAPIIMYHHENFDGTGYPKGLKGAEIPLGARIMAVVGSFEAMIGKRPYRVSLPIKKAIEEIKKHSGRQFDPKAVRVFLNILRRKDIINLINKDRRNRK